VSLDTATPPETVQKPFDRSLLKMARRHAFRPRAPGGWSCRLGAVFDDAQATPVGESEDRLVVAADEPIEMLDDDRARAR
jgi:hypothetical protein